ncbi:MAG: CoA transferase [Chloroflexi bacterium]|nr:CoA transferase [Chloroflexota bacterium]
MAKALDDLRVLDLSTSYAGAWCTRLLGDFGADVVMLEPRAGHQLRRLAPFAPDGRSIPALYVQANKRAVAMDVEDGRARPLLEALLREADVVVESYAPARLAQLGLDHAALERLRPGVILCSITPHGQSGELAGVPGNDLTAFARGGWASINGSADREPLNGSAFQASYGAGLAGYAGIVSALVWRDGHPGEGQHVDVAEVEVAASTFAPALLRSLYHAEPHPRRVSADIAAGPVPVADGHFALTISRAHFWRDAMTLLGLHDLAEDQRWEAGWYRQQHREEYVTRVQERMAGWKKMELFDELAVRRVVAGPVLTMEELVANPHLAARGFWAKAADDPDGPTYPGAPFKLPASPWGLERRAPHPGEHTLEVLGALPGVDEPRLRALLDAGVIGLAVAAPQEARA